MVYRLIKHAGCWKNTRRIGKSRATGKWFTNSSRVLPTSQVVYQPINHKKVNSHINLFVKSDKIKLSQVLQIFETLHCTCRHEKGYQAVYYRYLRMEKEKISVKL